MVTAKIIVLRAIKHGEADLIVHGLDARGAKLGLFARSAMKSRKRFGGGILEPTHVLMAHYQEAKGESSLHVLQDAQLVEAFPKLRSDYDRLQTALEILNLVERSSVEGSLDSPQVFNLLGHSLTALQTAVSPGLLKLAFVAKLLASHGVLIEQSEYAPLLTPSVHDLATKEFPEELQRNWGRSLNERLQAYIGH
jgi:DNA repair protein RecO (recombination protein O)